MVRHPHRPVRFINLLVPICQHLADHPLFMRRLHLLQRRLTDAVARELRLLLDAFPEDEHDGDDLELLDSDEEGSSMGSTIILEDEDSVVDLADVESISDAMTVRVVEEGDRSVISEGGFGAGIRQSSSPQPGPSSGNHGRVSPTRAAVGSMSIELERFGFPPVANTSDSSDLPSLSLPDIQTHRTLSPLRRPQSLPSSAGTMASQTSSDNLTSVSHNLPPRGG